MQKYIFTQDWFLYNVPRLLVFLDEYKNKPCKLLEIGSFEGLSTGWFLENILTHEESSIISIDPCTGSIEHKKDEVENIQKNYAHNILLNFPNKATFFKGYSSDVLKYHNILSQKFDIILIDGDHRAHAVLEDAVLCFRLLKVGGIIIFDDYDWPAYKDDPPNHPKTGVDSFMYSYGHMFEIIDVHYQFIIKKIKD